ncbi:MAG TPA: TonB-dependent receptor [Bacteroidales bacterium]|nr:MAG: TonB-dependent receptor [Bacteroidetes bacterium GWF2_33_38]OFY71209.1 MAG: TonB-dependent receptor [Bacteroidetes bacterium RIFOXYA12_FULL_33_9]OFY90211.1 MAG: TonB-dependent receptor [Bacteroidetes bacterium RIFOXYA2_FULL_33_7]HBF88229.1 TonB-dependent receptor [Bacteroidales bacterium]
MSVKIIILLITLTAICSVLFAQKYTISGYVREKSSGEDLIGANIYAKEISKGTTSNQYGFYSLSLEKGKYSIVYSFIGYDDFVEIITLDKDIKKNIELSSSVITTKEVVVAADRIENIESTQMGQVRLPIEKVKVIPAFLGEIDVLKTIQLLPGVKSGGEGSSGFYVRGGGPDQNLILLDDATVYNASHLFGFFSVFNADAVKDINLIKGGMPAQYGGRLSSVLDITMKDGNNKKYEVDGGIGVISSRLTVQGPIKKDTSSFIVSARRTYIDILVDPFIKKTAKAKGSGYYFYDLNAKASYRFSDKDRLFISGYYGRDVFTFKNKEAGFDVQIPWGNGISALRWNHLFSDKLFLNTTATFSSYKFNFEASDEDYEFNMFSGITDYSIKSDFNYLPSVRHNLKFGISYIKHVFVPSSATAKINETSFDTGEIIKQHARDAAIYINEDFDVNEKLKISGGIRGTFFQQVGPFTRFVKDEYDKTIDTLYFDKGDNVKWYKHLEPRFSLRYSINMTSSIKASFTQNYQYIHLATISSASMPTDLWIPSSEIVQPQYGVQYALGYFRNFKNDMFETSIEVYYKELENQIEYKDGANPMNTFGDNSDNFFAFGSGQSYGLELFLKKRLGKTTGWIGYTWSKTYRTFENLNNGESFPAKYDRRHDISFIATHELNEKWVFAMVFVYSTGNALTLPEGKYYINGMLANQYGKINSYRMAPYHRLDLSATYYVKKNKKIESSWNFAVFNAYNRYNPYFIYFVTEGTLAEGNLETKAKQVSLFPILPSITWNFKF